MSNVIIQTDILPMLMITISKAIMKCTKSLNQLKKATERKNKWNDHKYKEFEQIVSNCFAELYILREELKDVFVKLKEIYSIVVEYASIDFAVESQNRFVRMIRENSENAGFHNPSMYVLNNVINVGAAVSLGIATENNPPGSYETLETSVNVSNAITQWIDSRISLHNLE